MQEKINFKEEKIVDFYRSKVLKSPPIRNCSTPPAVYLYKAPSNMNIMDESDTVRTMIHTKLY